MEWREQMNQRVQYNQSASVPPAAQPMLQACALAVMCAEILYAASRRNAVNA